MKNVCTGFSSPSKISSLAKVSMQSFKETCPRLCSWGIGKDKSQNGSNVVLQFPQWVHFSSDFNCPTNKSVSNIKTLKFSLSALKFHWLSIKQRPSKFFASYRLFYCRQFSSSVSTIRRLFADPVTYRRWAAKAAISFDFDLYPRAILAIGSVKIPAHPADCNKIKISLKIQ